MSSIQGRSRRECLFQIWEYSRPSQEAADGVHRSVAKLLHYKGNYIKTQKENPGVHKPVSEKGHTKYRHLLFPSKNINITP